MIVGVIISQWPRYVGNSCHLGLKIFSLLGLEIAALVSEISSVQLPRGLTVFVQRLLCQRNEGQ